MSRIKLANNIWVTKAKFHHFTEEKWRRCLACDGFVKNGQVSVRIASMKNSRRFTYIHLGCFEKYANEMLKNFKAREKEIMCEVL